MNKLLNTKELADYLGLAHQTIRVWVSQRRIPFLKIQGAVRFSEVEIQEILDRSRKESIR
ncbi:helix-turn-helix domain-containing protein [Sphaerochaeta sp.]|uniref:helix-turn-helix domain-containing protein n=1 Tax=Sphaerochaeta sp. TaxID=1972642 RepID=UPI002A35DFEB|nr:helix-turn-helix domain-containing protein [Sphaerochaeta sp.]MDD2297991.1 helix-turn-helix domain-containing protein [Sphaerochaetaceae bacterium]MDX9985324.1 helix-turn-helix domain-containing protein [Sphaerochaeta sp.]